MRERLHVVPAIDVDCEFVRGKLVVQESGFRVES